MTTTSNYKLSQWAATDPVRRSDFNSDNAKIDAAIAGKTEFVKLKELTLTGKVTSAYTLSLSGINMAAWQYVLLDIHLVGDGTFNMFPTGSKSATCNVMTNSSSQSGFTRLNTAGFYRIIFLTMGDPSAPMQVLTLGPQLIYGKDDTKFSQVTGMEFQPYSGAYFDPGTKFTVWGIK